MARTSLCPGSIRPRSRADDVRKLEVFGLTESMTTSRVGLPRTLDGGGEAVIHVIVGQLKR